MGVVDSAGQTQTGHVRHDNEDSYLMRGPLFMVADGVGGAAAGEIASTMCAEAFAEIDLIRRNGPQALRDAIGTANRRIFDRAAGDPGLAGMGTTVTAALVDRSGRIDLANVGDSRAYLLRDDSLQRISEDHSVVAELVAAGQITEAEAAVHPQRNVITRVLGSEPTVQVDLFSIEPQPDDLLLLCSDGLTDMVSEDEVASVMAEGGSCEQLVRKLIRSALAGGGEDNVTAIAFRMGETDEADSTAAVRTILTVDPDLEPDDEDEQRTPVNWRRVLGLRESHFVGANESTGRIEVYQGVPIDLFAGIKLYHAVYASPVTYASLDPETRKELFDHRLRSLDSARQAVRRIEEGSP
jgi:protein phosphatase